MAHENTVHGAPGHGAPGHGAPGREAGADCPRELIDLALEAAAAGARVHTEAVGRVRGITGKGEGFDVVTAVDHEAQAAIVAVLRAARPADAVLGEESLALAGGSGVTWVVDPLDGTRNLVTGYPAYSVSIGIEIGARAVGGVVADSSRGIVYQGGRGLRALRDGEPIAVSRCTRPREALVGTGFLSSPEIRRYQAECLGRVLGHVRDVRRSGSPALDLCQVACGHLDAHFELGLAPWDVAAGIAIVEAAGGVVTTRSATEARGTVLIAAGAGLIEPLVELLERERVVEAD